MSNRINIVIDARALRFNRELSKLPDSINESELGQYSRIINRMSNYYSEIISENNTRTLKILLKDSIDVENIEYDVLGLPKSSARQHDLYRYITETTGVDPTRETVYSKKSGAFGARDIQQTVSPFGVGGLQHDISSPVDRIYSEDVVEKRAHYEKHSAYRTRKKGRGHSSGSNPFSSDKTKNRR